MLEIVFADATGHELASEMFGDWRKNRRDYAHDLAEEIGERHESSVGVYVQGRRNRALFQFAVPFVPAD